MTDFGRRTGQGDMLKSVYDPNDDGVIAIAQTEANMVGSTWAPVIANIAAIANFHKERHQDGGSDEIDVTGLVGIPDADMLKSVYDPNDDGVIAVAQTEADMTKVVYDVVLANIVSAHENHSDRHEDGGWDEISVLGLVGTTPTAILGKAAVGRRIRYSRVLVQDGTTANSLKLRFIAQFNGDTIAVTDNVIKGATTGNFKYSGSGWTFTILNAGLTGSVEQARGRIYLNSTGTSYHTLVEQTAEGIAFTLMTRTGGSELSWDNPVNLGEFRIDVIYITDT